MIDTIKKVIGIFLDSKRLKPKIYSADFTLQDFIKLTYHNNVYLDTIFILGAVQYEPDSILQKLS